MRGIASFSDDEKAVIRARHLGWEKARASVLARIFDTHINTIRAIVRIASDGGSMLGFERTVADCPTSAAPLSDGPGFGKIIATHAATANTPGDV